MPLVVLELNAPTLVLTLNDPTRRNALSSAMFDALESALDAIAAHDGSTVLHLRGEGNAFCSGFDLGACVADPTLLPHFIRRLSVLTRRIRRLRQVVVAEVRGAALAGGSAIVSACDFVCVAPTSKLGYPVHRIGVSPAVTLPTLIGKLTGRARSLTLSGELMDGHAALAFGLATHCNDDPGLQSAELCAALSAKGPVALAATKRWLNELDGSDCDDPFDRTAEDTSLLVGPDGAECRRMLEAFWQSRA